MMDPIRLTASAETGAAGAAAPPDPAKVRKAAEDFEALLIGQMLKTAREASSGGWMGTGEGDPAGDQAMGVAEEFFARSLASSGGLGLARMVAQGLAEKAVEKKTP